MTRILVVDDEAQILRALRASLRGAGYDVDTADTAEAALTALAVNPPDAVILDLVLPDGRGTDVDGKLVQLTPHEFELLAALARNPDKLMTHTALLREVWGGAYGDESHYLHVYVSQLRRKLEPDPARPRYIITEPGAGYRLLSTPLDASSKS
jgi:DNA-binding response OmpR family regulator